MSTGTDNPLNDLLRSAAAVFAVLAVCVAGYAIKYWAKT